MTTSRRIAPAVLELLEALELLLSLEASTRPLEGQSELVAVGGLLRTEGDGSLSTGERLRAWLDPFQAASVGTCLAQWAVVLGVLLLARKTLAARSLAADD